METISWIAPGTLLNGECVELLPLEEKHFPELVALARTSRIWEFFPVNMSSDEQVLAALTTAIAERKKGTQFPFVIFHKQHKKIIGSTRLMDLQPAHRKAEIGWTWMHPDYWASEANFECKLLLLTFGFETLKAIRVYLKTDENNLRSRKAIEKIGGRFEGILRQDMIRHNGTYRNSAYYGIIDKEWPELKPKLTALFDNKKTT
jgi:RimJ/RimL family protein N-acetyltransferase